MMAWCAIALLSLESAGCCAGRIEVVSSPVYSPLRFCYGNGIECLRVSASVYECLLASQEF